MATLTVARLRRHLPLGLLLTLALASAWTVRVLEMPQVRVQRSAPHEPDYYLERFVTTVMDDSGRPRRRIEAEYLAHFPDTDTKELSRPQVILYRDGAEPWRVVAERGWISANDDVMLLLGAVRIWRNAPDGGKDIEIRTRDLRVLPQTDYGETDQPVVIETPRSVSQGVGMRAYLRQGRVELLSNVRTRYAPARR